MYMLLHRNHNDSYFRARYSINIQANDTATLNGNIPAPSSIRRQFPMDKPARLGYNKGKIFAKERCP